MEDKKPTKDEQKRIDVCENVVNWASKDKEHRGCIVLAADEEASTCAVIGNSQNLTVALTSALRSIPNLRSILLAVMMLDVMIGGSKNDTDRD